MPRCCKDKSIHFTIAIMRSLGLGSEGGCFGKAVARMTFLDSSSAADATMEMLWLAAMACTAA